MSPVPAESPAGAAGGPRPVRAATTLTLWAAARASVSTDALLQAVEAAGGRAGIRAGNAEVAELTGLPGPGEPSAGTMALLPLLRKGGRPELLLPHAGDLRGLPPRGDITVPALDVGAVVVLPELGIGLLPVDGLWRAYRCTGGNPPVDLLQAHQLIDDAVTDATRRLMTADIARGSDRVRERVREMILAEAVDTPPGTPQRASALLAKAISLQALLAVAAGHETAAVTSRELAVVDDALRPLTYAVREGRRAAVDLAVRTLAGDDRPSRIS
ncbi:hypothetical protein GIS00_07595 [Nakamurella sp. YIM 132087]|uniref:Uncharacterized protein n=1 Tax=Nakamurella alba TaxID=2665158 RepID=A0A7K1FKN4_9ACTN|nr:hypothetical protein [Nakamurella alba]MTD13803.1 hypothetical protein [Nakamurella alba]